MTQPDPRRPLAGRRIAVPESRQLDVLDRLLTRRGAEVLRCPLLEIVDAPDAAPVLAWLRAFLHSPPDYFILMTGEGLARLRGFADGGGIATDALKAALEETTLISRGPKPARELRHLGLVPELFAPRPTTDGVIELLKGLDIDGRSVALQLYGEDPNVALVSYLQQRSAKITTVAPYRYAPRLSHEHIAKLLAELQQGSLDAIVFTSKAQVERLFKVSAELDVVEALESGLARTFVAAIGPVVADVLAAKGCQADVMPDERYFMKPLVQTLSQALPQDERMVPRRGLEPPRGYPH